MDHANKFILVPEHKASNHIATEGQLSLFDKEMLKILKSSMNEHEKVKRYYELLQRKMNLQENNQPWSAVKQEEEKVPKPVEQDYSSIVLNSVPSTLKRQAGQLLELLKTHSDQLKWTNQGQLVIKGETLKDSNLADLFHLIFTNKNAKQVPAANEFLQAFQELNIPKHYIKNRSLLKIPETIPEETIKQENFVGKSPRRKAKNGKWQSMYK